MASKALAGKSSAAIAEILGISSSSTTAVSSLTPSPSASHSPSPYPGSDASASALTQTPSTDGELKLQELNTSRKSVSDYFKEKLAAKGKGKAKSSPLATEVSTPSAGAEEEDPDDVPRGGLGARRVLAW